MCEIFIYMWEYNRKLLNYTTTGSICKQLKKERKNTSQIFFK